MAMSIEEAAAIGKQTPAEGIEYEPLSDGNYCVECLTHIDDMTERHLDATEGHCWQCWAMQMRDQETAAVRQAISRAQKHGWTIVSQHRETGAFLSHPNTVYLLGIFQEFNGEMEIKRT